MIIRNGIEVPLLMADGWSKTQERVYLFSSIYSIKIYWYCENNIIQFIYICFSHYSKLCICNRRFWEVVRSLAHEIAFSTYLFYYSTGNKWFLVESIRARPFMVQESRGRCSVRRGAIFLKLLIRMELLHGAGAASYDLVMYDLLVCRLYSFK